MTITDVSKAAGVSIATVSRVINRHPRVLPDSVRAVERAMVELGYTPPPVSSGSGGRAPPPFAGRVPPRKCGTAVSRYP